jgi:pantoate--beta-alanine ligase
METVQTISKVREIVAAARRTGKTIGLVPTMGALHAGHMSLIDAAKAACDFVVVSIFVNPIQFGPSEDLSKYPRPIEADLAACREHGADVVFNPSAAEMYPRHGRPAHESHGTGGGAPIPEQLTGKMPVPLTAVTMSKLGDGLCGRARPGHFTGVCTVVAKLFNIVGPDKAFFGAKDFQQARIIRQMVADLDFPLEIVVCPIVREADGLAMSSRNVYLKADERRQAPALHQSLLAASEMIRSGETHAVKVADFLTAKLQAATPLGVVDYIAIVDAQTLEPLDALRGEVLIALAVKFPSARLIDNIVVDATAGNS